MDPITITLAVIASTLGAGGLTGILARLFSKVAEAQAERVRDQLDLEFTRNELVDDSKPSSRPVFRVKAIPHSSASSRKSARKRIRTTSSGEGHESGLLREYYTQGISQSRISFVASLVAASAGFVLILVGCARALVDPDLSTSVVASTVPILAGAITEAIAALFFTQANRARVLMSDMHEKLRVDKKNDREFEKAMKLLDQIKADEARDELKASIARHFVGVVTAAKGVQDHQSNP